MPQKPGLRPVLPALSLCSALRICTVSISYTHNRFLLQHLIYLYLRFLLLFWEAGFFIFSIRSNAISLCLFHSRVWLTCLFVAKDGFSRDSCWLSECEKGPILSDSCVMEEILYVQQVFVKLSAEECNFPRRA